MTGAHQVALAATGDNMPHEAPRSLVVLRGVERRLGLTDRLATCLKDPRTRGKVVHRLEIIRFRMLMIAAGYEDGDNPTRCAAIQ